MGTKKTRRCAATFEAGESCPEMRVWCPSFCVPNRDPWQCRQGNQFWIKDFYGTQPQVYCDDRMPTIHFPAVGKRLKLWYIQEPPTQAQRYAGLLCIISCSI